jgi:hypothetical protein
MRLLTVVCLAIPISACGVPSPVAPVLPSTAAPALHATQLQAFYAPLDVYAGGSAQIHVGTFAANAGALNAVYDATCTFQSDAGFLTVDPQGLDTSWHVATVATDQSVAGRNVHVQATCGDLSTTVTFNVAPLGAKPPLVPVPPPSSAGCFNPTCTPVPPGTTPPPPTAPPTTGGT